MSRGWGQEEIQVLRQHIKQGTSTGDIARALKRSKGSIVGMVFRLRHEKSSRERAKAGVKIEKPAKARFQRFRLDPVGHPFVRVLLQELNNQQCTFPMLAERSGLEKHTFVNWRHHCPKVSDLEAALNVMGLTMRPRPIKERENNGQTE